MTESEKALLQRILSFSFDHGDEELTFAARLARENGWTSSYTDRVLVEYKRFVFLAMVADHPVTPSDQVDQAWHLHLTYTRSYWDQLCGEVLGRPLHHGPTQGGEKEATKYADWYAKTRKRYEAVFGEAPPANIWPDSAIRFGVDLHYQRVNTKRHWVVPLPAMLEGLGMRGKGAIGAIAAAVVLLLSLIAALTLQESADRVPQLMALNANIYTEPIFWLIVLAIVGFISYAIAVGYRCPKCKKKQAMDKTGKIQKRGRFRANLIEWKCKFCGEVQWKKDTSHSDSGAGGCGGGCGGD